MKQETECIEWSPLDENLFVKSGSALEFYKVLEVDHEIVKSYQKKLRLDDNTVAELITSTTDYNYISCFTWCPSLDEYSRSHLIAVGQAKGNVSLMSLQHDRQPCLQPLHEYIPSDRHNINVNALSWSPCNPKYLAAGYRKQRNDAPVKVFDMSALFSKNPEVRSLGSNGDCADSLCYSLRDEKMLIVGMNGKQLRCFDMDTRKCVADTSSPAVDGICFDPSNENRFASYSDKRQVCIWDVRNIKRLVLTLNSPDDIRKIAWCHTRSGFLAALGGGIGSIQLYDIYSVGGDFEPVVLSRSVSKYKNNFSFSWHPSSESKILILNSGGLHTLKIQERMCLSWSASRCLVSSTWGKGLQEVGHEHAASSEFEDISSIMIDRAKKGYGLCVDKDLPLNGERAENPVLKRLWTWLYMAHTSVQTMKLPNGTSYKYQGVLDIIRSGGQRSEHTIKNQWNSFDGSDTALSKVYKSDERGKCIRLCMWDSDSSYHPASFISKLEKNGEHTRAAAIAVFNDELKQAIQVLQKGAKVNSDPALNTTAMAISGFTDEKKTLWCETCSKLRNHFSDKYLQAIFAFLTEGPDSYKFILNEPAITVQDRVAFACMYLPNLRLIDYLEELSRKLRADGNLDGILLTGLGSLGMDLLQKYLDITGDIQTVALIAVHFLQRSSSDDQAELWVSSYKNLLDCFGLWNERAQIDVISNRIWKGEIPSVKPHISVVCRCGEKLHRNPISGTSSLNKAKTRVKTPPLAACPKCMKPLPRCALCLMRMGTASNYSGPSLFSSTATETASMTPVPMESSTVNMKSRRINDFSKWFTWCQTCRHGGHAEHITQWFSENCECPVTGCSCKCMSLDKILKTPQLK